MEIRHNEFADGVIDRFAISQHCVVGFGDGAPFAADFKNRNSMISVALVSA